VATSDLPQLRAQGPFDEFLNENAHWVVWSFKSSTNPTKILGTASFGAKCTEANFNTVPGWEQRFGVYRGGSQFEYDKRVRL